jgi:hypothetical protein
MDRMLPLSYFEKDSAGGRQAVSITISGVNQVSTTVSDPSEDNAIEGEFTESGI